MSKLPVALAAVRLLPFAERGRSLIYVASGDHRAEGIAHLLSELAPEAAVAFIPAWDCLPYDRASPSPDVLGRTMAALRRLDAHVAGKGQKAGAILVTTLEAAVQRLPPASAAEALDLAVGDAVDPAALRATLERFGYRPDDRVDDHGEFALRGEVLDLFPPGPAPYRLALDGARIAAIHTFDPASQRSVEAVEALTVDPVSTVLAPAGAEPLDRFPGLEHRLAEHYPELRTVFDLLPKAALMMEPTAASRLDDVLAQAAEHHRDAVAAGGSRAAGGARPLPPESLYLAEKEWRAAAKRRLQPLPGAEPSLVPYFHAAPNARKRCAAFVAERAAAGHRVVLTGATPKDRTALVRALDRPVDGAEGWPGVLAAGPGTVLTLALSAEHGFVDDEEKVTMVCAADLLGGAAHRAGHHHHHAVAVPWHAGDGEFAIGDAVIHIDHGVGVLRAVETIASEAAGSRDTVRLDYAKDADLLAPVESLDQVWRYGGAGDAVKLDRLDDGSWPKRRQRAFGEIATAARALVDLARQREATRAPVLKAPAAAYRAFTARFPFPPTPDQADAIAAVIADLASGRPMDRLVVGDVGFGKTEVALRAAAVAALAGRQVALVAPTTVLVRQHVATFTRRFAELGIGIAHLSRLTPPAEARAVKAGLADGSVRIVVGTHAVAAADVAFKELGLLMVDEEQRFGAAEKARLRELGAGVHVLTLTATPIPRTLQAALVGLQDLSVIATPPARRRPIRTVVAPYDAATVRGALLREKARGGQSFVIVPRVEGLERMAKGLAESCPELTVLSAHGRMAPEEVDAAMVDFAEGHGDVLVATSIIESGLDVPRANTMVVAGAELFGLSQLHQIRGRVGRGRLQGLCYLMTEGEAGEAAMRRLGSLAAFDRLGSGFALSGQDLDLRGAGDLVGEEQAGHLRLIGLGLYQHLMGLAIREAKGETVEDWSPEIHVDHSGSLPADYIPEPELRLNLYARLSRVSDPQEAEAVAEEVADRFGPPPAEVEALLERTRLRALCRQQGVARVEAGPKGIALDLRPGRDPAALAERAPAALRDRIRLKGARLIYPLPSDTPRERLSLATSLLAELN
ncbi:TRCF domain-containing protein [Lichenibacterium dinghuense]|uniref:TRCF domain-containing protein n=1 Tax=Lichenibacterium dinghuense TaxID=2895977 RepID=UPI001F011763|nr:TRCF domain-containing protein [Lichenibacterium sp. 6Y81]